jgi:hypothetical protein
MHKNTCISYDPSIILQSFMLIRLVGFTLLEISPICYVTVPLFSTVFFVTTWKQEMWYWMWTTQKDYTKHSHYSKDNNHWMSYALKKTFSLCNFLHQFLSLSFNCIYITAVSNIYFRYTVANASSQIKCKEPQFLNPTIVQKCINNGNIPHFIHTNM